MIDPYCYAETIKKAARRARGERLSPLYSLCEGQKTVSTSKLMDLVENLHNSDKGDAIHLKALADRIATLESENRRLDAAVMRGAV